MEILISLHRKEGRKEGKEKYFYIIKQY